MLGETLFDGVWEGVRVSDPVRVPVAERVCVWDELLERVGL
jgi:hypothetical protein